MNATIINLLEPVRGDQPCGPDLANDPKRDELTQLAKGKPEIEIGPVARPAEPPDWRELKAKSAAYLAESKDLTVAVMYACSLLKTEGLAGFCDGLQLIQGWLERYWPELHPRLDPEDNLDPTQRLSILGGLTAPRGSVSGWLRIIDYLYAAEICRPQARQPIRFDQLEAAKNLAPGSPELDALSSALRSAGQEALTACQANLTATLAAAQSIDQLLSTALGVGNTISFEVLLTTLKTLIALLEPYLAAGGGAPPAGAGAGGEPQPGTAGVSLAVRGAIKSRDDVIRAIETICDYYRQVEPSSPVPYVLRRAQKMVRMNFVEAVQELSIASVDALRPSMGSSVDSAQPPSS